MIDKRGRGRPRRADADGEILEATLQLLREGGYRSFNVDVIAGRTGIAKTTIYRRWPSKAALIAAAIAPVAPGSARDGAAIVEEIEAIFAVLGPFEDDGLDVIRAVLEPRRPLLTEALNSAAAADAELGRLIVRFLLAPR